MLRLQSSVVLIQLEIIAIVSIEVTTVATDHRVKARHKDVHVPVRVPTPGCWVVAPSLKFDFQTIWKGDHDSASFGAPNFDRRIFDLEVAVLDLVNPFGPGIESPLRCICAPYHPRLLLPFEAVAASDLVVVPIAWREDCKLMLFARLVLQHEAAEGYAIGGCSWDAFELCVLPTSPSFETCSSINCLNLYMVILCPDKPPMTWRMHWVKLASGFAMAIEGLDVWITAENAFSGRACWNLR